MIPSNFLVDDTSAWPLIGSASAATLEDELAPWGWRTYATEFQDRQDAERRLRALAAMPGRTLNNCEWIFGG
eukprot:6391019-Amphidinium_carterae.1